jgi:hypothetical protein
MDPAARGGSGVADLRRSRGARFEYEAGSADTDYLELFLRLRFRFRVIKKKSHNLLEYFFADVHRAVNAIAGLRPIHFANRDFPRLSITAIAEFDIQQIPAQDHGHPMKGIAMPRRRFPRRQPLSPDQVISAMMQHLLV